jgi:hypothetical protein
MSNVYAGIAVVIFVITCVVIFKFSQKRKSRHIE